MIHTTIPSTGCCPAEWRSWWATESRRVGTDWIPLIEAAEGVLRKFRVLHAGVSSS
jgi:hypothetical protein